MASNRSRSIGGGLLGGALSPGFAASTGMFAARFDGACEAAVAACGAAAGDANADPSCPFAGGCAGLGCVACPAAGDCEDWDGA